MDPLVSVTIPAFKATFLDQAIASVLNQTYQNIEIIVVNDHSPEDITSIVNSFNDKRIVYYVNSENVGGKDPVANWNRCLSYAKGDFFSLICDDDIYEPTFLERMIELASKYPNCNVFRSRVKVINERNQLIDFYPSAPEWESFTDYMWHRISGYRRQSISEFMYRRQHIVDLGGYIAFPKAWCADDTSIYLFSKLGGIVSTNELLVSFRVSGINISSCNNDIIEKVEAQNLYTSWIHKLLEDIEEEFKNVVILARVSRERTIMTDLLTRADWKNFILLFIHRRRKNTFIGSRSFLKAINQKIAKKLKRN